MSAGDGYGDLVDATVLVPTPDDAELAGEWALVEREVVSTLMEEDDTGLLMPGFTSVDALQRWRPEGGCYVERPSAWFFGVASADPEGRVAIDPGSPDARVLGPREVALLAAGQSPADAAAGGTLLIATPIESLPDDVTAAVSGALEAEPAAVSAKLFLVDQTGEGPQPMVMVELAEVSDGDAVNAAMGHIVQGIADRTEEAGGLTFAVVTEEWRSTYESGGLDLYRR